MDKLIHNSNNNWIPAFLLIIPGLVLLGLGIGLFLEQPGFGAIGGFGAGLLAWGFIIVLKS